MQGVAGWQHPGRHPAIGDVAIAPEDRVGLRANVGEVGQGSSPLPCPAVAAAPSDTGRFSPGFPSRASRIKPSGTDAPMPLRTLALRYRRPSASSHRCPLAPAIPRADAPLPRSSHAPRCPGTEAPGDRRTMGPMPPRSEVLSSRRTDGPGTVRSEVPTYRRAGNGTGRRPAEPWSRCPSERMARRSPGLTVPGTIAPTARRPDAPGR